MFSVQTYAASCLNQNPRRGSGFPVVFFTSSDNGTCCEFWVVAEHVEQVGNEHQNNPVLYHHWPFLQGEGCGCSCALSSMCDPGGVAFMCPALQDKLLWKTVCCHQLVSTLALQKSGFSFMTDGYYCRLEVYSMHAPELQISKYIRRRTLKVVICY